MRRDIDLLIYSDLADPFGTEIGVGDNGEKLGHAGLHVVAVGPPIHDGKDVTVVLAHGPGPMKNMQRLLDSGVMRRDLLVRALAEVSHSSWRNQAHRDKGVPLSELPVEVTPHDLERAEDAVTKLEELGVVKPPAT